MGKSRLDRTARTFAYIFTLAAATTLAGCGAGAHHEPKAADVAAPSIPSFQKVRDGLYRGGRPDEAGLDQLKALGVRTIVDLELGDFVQGTPWSVAAGTRHAEARGFTVVRAPMSAFEPGLGSRFDARIDEILAVLRDPSRGPVFVHCKHGQDRTGLVIALERVLLEGWPAAAAHAEMLSLGFHPTFKGLNRYFTERTGFPN